MAPAIEMADDQDEDPEGCSWNDDAPNFNQARPGDWPTEAVSSYEGLAEVRVRAGRPRRVGPAPWEILGYSKRTYYRRKKLGLLPKGKK